MTDDPVDPRILANLQRLKDAGAGEDALNAYLHEEQGKAKPAVSTMASRAAIRQRQNANDMEQAQAEQPSYLSSALGGIASLARDIPGAEAAQAGARSLLRGQPYTQALGDIRGAEDDNPASGLNRVIGAIPAVAAMPGSPMLAGARYGSAKGLLGADPAAADTRLHDAAKEGTIGAIAGKAGEWLGTGTRALAATPLGKKALAMTAAMRAADNVAYGHAAAEGVGAIHPDVTTALAAPDIAPYAAAIRGSRSFAGADDATVLREAYKLMSEHQGKLQNAMANATDFKAGTSLGAADTKLAKEQLLSSADQMMPSFRGAVAGHSTMAANMDAFKAAADATKRIGMGTAVAGKKLAQNSPEAFAAAIDKMTPEQAKAAIDGLLGRLKGQVGLSPNPLKLFGIPNDATQVNRMAPYLRALDTKAGNRFTGLLSNATTAGLLGQ